MCYFIQLVNLYVIVIDTNECLTDNGGCDHICINTDGSFQCSCNASYLLVTDNKTCNAISKCKNFTVMQEPTGNISVPGFPLLYANCTWVITLPVQYKSVELQFDEVSIEESPDCVNDQLTVLNGKSKDSLVMAKYCDTQTPFTIQSSTGDVTIKFVSDSIVNGMGFSLQYKGLTEQVTGIRIVEVLYYG